MENPDDDAPFVRLAMKELGFECEFSDLDVDVMSSVLRLATIIKRGSSPERRGLDKTNFSSLHK